MSVETEPTDETEHPDVDALGRDLGEAIQGLPEYESFVEAKRAVQTDEALQEDIQAFEGKQHEFLLARQTGEATEEDLEALRAAQEDLHAQPKMAAFLSAKEDLADRLSVVNDAISEPLEVDFGGEAGGCCHD